VEEHAVLDKNSKIDLHINNKVWKIPFPCAYVVCAKYCTLLMIRCWRRSPLVKPQRFHRCMRSLNVVCKCKMCTTAFSMDGQRWFRCRWWSVDSPLHPRRHRRRCLTRDRLHRPQWMSIWRHHHRLRPLQRQLLVVRHLHQCLWSSGPLLPVEGSPLAPSMLLADASSSLATVQIGWHHLPLPMGGPNGPLPGLWRFLLRWPVWGEGWGRRALLGRGSMSRPRDGSRTGRGTAGPRVGPLALTGMAGSGTRAHGASGLATRWLGEGPTPARLGRGCRRSSAREAMAAVKAGARRKRILGSRSGSASTQVRGPCWLWPDVEAWPQAREKAPARAAPVRRARRGHQERGVAPRMAGGCAMEARRPVAGGARAGPTQTRA
jgi:hypothetical protein